MIYYFTGTGNSGYVALELEYQLREKAYFMNSQASLTPEGDSIGFVFPVYAWGVPPNVVSFIKNLHYGFWDSVKIRQLPVWIVMTCGDEVAMAPEMIEKLLIKVGVKPESIWSVIMPNNYVLLPGFDVDSKELEQKKLAASADRIREIVSGIRSRRSCVDVTRGSLPGLKSRLVYPLFKKWGISSGKWHGTNACVGCGICVKSCPQNNIILNDAGMPVWGDNCCSCLACYHSCPRHAVEYGKETRRKGQYLFPRALKHVK